MNTVTLISASEARIFQKHWNRGDDSPETHRRYLCKGDKGVWVAIDNSSGHAWTESFKTKIGAYVFLCNSCIPEEEISLAENLLLAGQKRKIADDQYVLIDTGGIHAFGIRDGIGYLEDFRTERGVEYFFKTNISACCIRECEKLKNSMLWPTDSNSTSNIGASLIKDAFKALPYQEQFVTLCELEYGSRWAALSNDQQENIYTAWFNDDSFVGFLGQDIDFLIDKQLKDITATERLQALERRVREARSSSTALKHNTTHEQSDRGVKDV